ncbi:MAG: ABC transporter ATP-binding protein [Proteobacteria bacterium]|nr:ABC transporter ATP-binding protein [Pseudomonadota bacterium]
MTTLEIRNVSKTFGDVEVLRDISLAIEDGEFLVLVGPSGCGKTTLLNCLAGLENVTSGDILFNGRRVNDVAPKDRDIGMVFQNYALYPNMDVRGNIAFGLEMRKVPKAVQAEKIAEVARMLQIEPLLGRRPGQLSGGQRQRVAIGRALAREAGLFLFDEPLSNLDAKLRVEMRAEIKLLHQRTRTTSVYVTHDQVEAMTLGSRICIMKDARIQQFGTPRDLYQNPANLFVAGFIGSPAMNFIPVSPRRAGQELAFSLNAAETQTITLPAPPGAATADLVLGIRPEEITLAPAQGAGEAGLDCEILMVEPTGPDTLLSVMINGAKVQARVPPHVDFRPGERVRLALSPARMMLFDPGTGARISADR